MLSLPVRNIIDALRAEELTAPELAKRFGYPVQRVYTFITEARIAGVDIRANENRGALATFTVKETSIAR